MVNVSGITSYVTEMADTTVSDILVSTRINQVSPLYVQLEFALSNTGTTTQNASLGVW
jgi:hypothetical protein